MALFGIVLISDLQFELSLRTWDVRRHLHICGFGRGEDGLEVHTLWVRNKISLFDSVQYL